MWLGTKYFNIKKYLEEEANLNDCNELTRKHSEIFVDGKVDKTKILANYDDRCVKVRVLEDALIKSTSEQGWNNIMVVVDDSVPKPRLNFDEFPPELVAANNLMLTLSEPDDQGSLHWGQSSAVQAKRSSCQGIQEKSILLI